jgi:heptosyltransferase III
MPMEIDFDKVERVLVIKLRHLGDVLLSTPVFSNLKKVMPHAAIDAYIWKEACPILEGHPAISHLHLYDRNWKKAPFLTRAKHELRLLHQIRSSNYDLILNLTEGDRGAIVAFTSGAPYRVGVKPKKKRIQKIFTHLVKPCPNPRHTVERDLDALRKIGIFPMPSERELCFHVPEEAKLRVKKLVPTTPYVLIHPTSRWRFKCLPAKTMASVIDALEETVVLTGAPSEVDFLEEIASLTNRPVINLGGKTSLKELGALMLQAQGLITVDSVSLHMASALKCPVVALFGPTSEENWGPWRHPYAEVVTQNYSCRPCRLDGCGGSKRSDCLWTLPAQGIVDAYQRVASAATFERTSTSSLLVLNSCEIDRIE